MISFGAPADDDIESHVIIEDVMVVAASRSHPILRRRQRIRINDLLQYRWVLAPASVESRRWLDGAFDARGLERPLPQIEINLLLLMPGLIEATHLLTFISRRHLASSCVGAALREVPVKALEMRRDLKVLHRKDAYLPPAAKRLLALIRNSGTALIET